MSVSKNECKEKRLEWNVCAQGVRWEPLGTRLKLQVHTCNVLQQERKLIIKLKIKLCNYLVSIFLSVELRQSTLRKASSRVLSAWAVRFCNSSKVIPVRAISDGPSWYNYKPLKQKVTIVRKHLCHILNRNSGCKLRLLWVRRVCKKAIQTPFGQRARK